MRLFSFLLFFVIAVPIFAGSAIAQDDDKDWLTQELQELLSDAGRRVDISGFSGALSSRASIDQLSIADEQGVWLTLHDISLNWTRAALFQGRLEVQELSAKKLVLSRLPAVEKSSVPSAEASSFSLPELPVNINIESLSINSVALGAPVMGEAALLTVNAAARLDEEGLEVSLKSSRLDGSKGKLNLDISLGRESNDIKIDTYLMEETGGIAARLLEIPDYPSVALTVQGRGKVDDFAADLLLKTDGQNRLAGKVAIARNATDTGRKDITADLAGDITSILLPEYQDFFGPDVSLRMRGAVMDDGEIQVGMFELDAAQASLEGQLGLGADHWPKHFEIFGRIAKSDQTPVLLPGGGGDLAAKMVVLRLSYDAARSDKYQARFGVTELTGGAYAIDQLQLTSEGKIVRSSSSLLGDMSFDVTGLSVDDEALQAALGHSFSGRAALQYHKNEPFRLTGLNLYGADYGMLGEVSFEKKKSLQTKLDINFYTQNLSRFAKLSKQQLDGAAQLSVRGYLEPFSGAFDIQLGGFLEDVTTEIDYIDPLLVGRTQIRTAARRDETGTGLSNIILRNSALDFDGQATLSSDAKSLLAKVTLKDTALILKDVSGSATVEGVFKEVAGQWQIHAKARAPHDLVADLQGVASNSQVDLDFQTRLASISPYVKGIAGGLSAKGRVFGSMDDIQISADATGPYGVLASINGSTNSVRFNARLPNVKRIVPELSGDLRIQGNAQRVSDGIQLRADMSGLSGARGKVGGLIAENGKMRLSTSGSLPLGLMNPFIKPRRSQGTARFDLKVNGPPSLKSISGQLRTDGATLFAPNLRLALHNMEAEVNLFDEQAQLNARADVKDGGNVSARGSVGLDGSMFADLSLVLGRVVIADPDLYRTVINGTAQLKGPLKGGAQVRGALSLEQTDIQVPSTGMTSIGDIPEIKQIGAPARVKESLRRAGLDSKGTAQHAAPGPGFGLDVTLNAPRRIFVRGRGLDAELGGSLRVTGTTTRPISAGGFELLRGRLDILGKRFDLEKGSVQFQGDLTPYILFASSTPTPQGDVRVQVEGPADQPKVSFTSSSEAPEDEVLSQLLFGRKISEISAFQALQLANAVAVLAGRSGGGLIGDLRGKFGLDDLDVTTTEDGATALKAGKYISEKVYTDITAASDGTGEVSLNLDLTGDVKAKARVDNKGNSGIGLFFEKDY